MEHIQNKYDPFLEIRLFCHTNKTSEDFYKLSEEERNKWMYSYSCRHFFTIIPAEENVLKRNRILCNYTELGCMFLASAVDKLEDDLKFEFIIKAIDDKLLECYAGKITSSISEEVKDGVKRKIFRRYKNIFMYSDKSEDLSEGASLITTKSPAINKESSQSNYNFLLSESVVECSMLSPEEKNDTVLADNSLSSPVFPDDIFAFVKLTDIKKIYLEHAEKKKHPVFEVNFEKSTNEKKQTISANSNTGTNGGFLQRIKNSIIRN